MGSCVVCDGVTSGNLEFCKIHYREHKQDILDKKPWVRSLKNDAQRERRRKAKEYEDTSLDRILDAQYTKRGY